MGPQEDYIETVVTCEGDFHDPQLPHRLECFRQRLKDLLITDTHKQLILKKVEPWNSVRVTFNIPREAALRLKQLAEQGSASLRQLGVLAVQIDGDHLVSLTLAAPNNQRTELLIRTHDGPASVPAAGSSHSTPAGVASVFDSGLPSSSDELGSPGPSNVEVTRKNIQEYLRQGSLFNSILAPANVSGAGSTSELSNPISDVFKTPVVCESGPLRPNNISSDTSASSSGLATYPQRTQLCLNSGFGVGTNGGVIPNPLSPVGPSPTHHSSRIAGTHTGQLSQATALPQTAAVGFNILSLPPPPPYPHGHGSSVINNVGRQGKKVTASSPLLVNLLQTEPLTGTSSAYNSKMLPPGHADKPKKKRRVRKKDKISVSQVLNDGEVLCNYTNTMLDAVGGSVPGSNEVGQTAEEINVKLSRRATPPVPSPLQRQSPLASSPGTQIGVYDAFTHRSPSSVNASSSSGGMDLQQSFDGEFAHDSIINPYTGQMEPRDSVPDLSPNKKDTPKLQLSPEMPESCIELSVSTTIPTMTSQTFSDSGGRKSSIPDVMRAGLSSVPPPGSNVFTSVSEELQRNFPITGVSAPPHNQHLRVSESLIGHQTHLEPSLVSAMTSTATSVASRIYAQHRHSSSSQIEPRAFPTAMPESATVATHLVNVAAFSQAGTDRNYSTINGPNRAPTSPKAVLSGTITAAQSTTLSQTRRVTTTRSGNPLFLPSHITSNAGISQHTVDPLHSFSVSSGVTLSGKCAGDFSSVFHSDSVLSKTTVVTEKHKVPSPQGILDTNVIMMTTSSDSHNLLNSSSTIPSSLPLAADSTNVISTTSPSGSKALSEGDENSNHSGILPDNAVDGANTTSSMLDGATTKAYNHDSGLGSSSERSDDTPSEPGDGEYHSGLTSTDPTGMDSSCGGKQAAAVVGSKSAVICSTEPTTNLESNIITVGYVQINEPAVNFHEKDSKQHHAFQMLPQSKFSIAGEGMTAEETLRSMSHLIKSTTDLSSIARVSTELDVKSAVQPSHVYKHNNTTNCQVSNIHQNGPVSLPYPHSLSQPTLPGHSSASLQGHSLSLPHSQSMPTVQHSHNSKLHTHGVLHGQVTGGTVGHSWGSAPSVQETHGTGGQTSVSNPLQNYSAASSTQAATDGVIQRQSPRLPSNTTAISINSSSVKFNNYDLSSMPPELISAINEASDLDILEAAQHLYNTHNNSSEDSQSMAFDSTDLATVGEGLREFGLSDFIDGGIRHVTTNGNNSGGNIGGGGGGGGGGSGHGVGGISTESRAGSNITSIYCKRSSPVNVNMLNHIYAPGLPLPRRLTESVQRLVKPLPASENPQPQARACKSPGASGSRHSSNGSTSPGRASQGGARSPGSSVSSAITSRILSFDKLPVSQTMLTPNNVVSSSSIGTLTGHHTMHMAQSSCSNIATSNCTTYSLKPGISHPSVAVHPSVSVAFSTSGNFLQSQSTSALNQSTFITQPSSLSSVLGPRPILHTTASSQPPLPPGIPSSSSSVKMSSGMVVSQNISSSNSQPHITAHSSSTTQDSSPSRLQLPLHNHSTSKVPSPTTRSPSTSLASLTGLAPAIPLSMGGSSSSSISSSHVSTNVGGAVGLVSSQNLLPVVQPSSQGAPRLTLPLRSSSVCNKSRALETGAKVVSGGIEHRLTLPSSSFSSSPLRVSSLQTPTMLAPSVHTASQPTTTIVTIATSRASPLSDLSFQTELPAVQAATSLSPFSTTITTTVSSVADTNISVEHTSGILSSPQTDSAVTTFSMQGSIHIPGRNVQEITSENSHPLKGSIFEQNDSNDKAASEIFDASVSNTFSEEELCKTKKESVLLTENTSTLLIESESETKSKVWDNALQFPGLLETAVANISLPGNAGLSTGDRISSNIINNRLSPSIDTLTQVKEQNEATNMISLSTVIKNEVEDSHVSTASNPSRQMHIPVPIFKAESNQERVQCIKPGVSENLHSKPPLLQPPPPPSIQTIVLSATPPPPALTPVPQDIMLKEISNNASSVQVPKPSTPPPVATTGKSIEGTSGGESFSTTTESDKWDYMPEDKMGEKNDDNFSTNCDDKKDNEVNLETFLSINSIAQDNSKQSASDACLQSSTETANDESSFRTRRIMRKRKSTQSESDSCESISKLTSIESGNSFSLCTSDNSLKSSADNSKALFVSTEHPHKLQRDGKKLGMAEEREKVNMKGNDVHHHHHHDKNIIEATPEEIAKKLASSTGGRRRPYYTYVPEKSLNQSYFDTPVLHGRTRSQSCTTKDKDVSPALTGTTLSPTSTPGQMPVQLAQPGTVQKEDGGEHSLPGSKRPTRSLRTKDSSDAPASKRRRSKEHR